MLIWRRKGWIVFAMLFFGGGALELFLENILGLGEFYYQDSSWPLPLILCLTAIICWKFGTLWNGMIPIDPQTGKPQEKTHTVFFMRMEFWAYILPFLAFFKFLFSHYDMTQ